MRMTRRTTWAALPVLAMLTLAGCSELTPTQTFDQRKGTTRVAELIDQRGDAVRPVTLKTPTSDFYLHMDCIGDDDAEIVVAISGVGEGAVPCSSDSGGGPGLIGLNKVEGDPISTFDVKVSVPKGARWSAAVDVEPAG
ncbi:hypothetical protein IFT73_16790 [Aeromicrobium sp. CFBP 8757]|uniref:hypothetical protein n=1 Tax=Aeromicrobium sp. CFBP 8757 TaxID=2775288 RepID=UPI001783E4E5|nr:hypothetical protein [Aeromicrobium sp. CFBP 8757]MBD8608514.1 hypothetical protein [Aeromicrobium sp. CFBP 8757]